jgi:hypothetical protein
MNYELEVSPGHRKKILFEFRLIIQFTRFLRYLFLIGEEITGIFAIILGRVSHCYNPVMARLLRKEEPEVIRAERKKMQKK